MATKPTYKELEDRCRLLEAKVKKQQKLQNLLHQAQKKEAIETLAGGIAHKFNNALSGIIGNIELLRMEAAECGNVTEYTERMMASAKKMAHLSNQLLAYAEGGKHQTEPLSLKNFIEHTLADFSHNNFPNIDIETEIDDEINDVKGDPSQIRILLSAILENATEAIKEKGHIWIKAQNKSVDKTFAEKHMGLKAGSYIYLKIVDDGIGMDNETKCRIFDPFFTTNFLGRGLGMAAVWGIVKSHNGWIDVESEPGRGTQTSIFLPADGDQKKKTIKPKLNVATGKGTILLIEDEKTVQDVERAMMRKLGYNVLTAEDGQEALDIVKTFDGRIELALLDLGLPGIGGRELYPLMMASRPDLKVIVCSGYPIDGLAQEIITAGAQDFIQKPFGFEALAAILKKNIDRRQYKRFTIEKGAVARPGAGNLYRGKLIDISKGGLSFCYKEGFQDEGESAIQSIDVLIDTIKLSDIHYKTASDRPLAESSRLKPAWHRRCGIQFVDLTSGNTDRLNIFIRNQAVS